MNRIGLRARLAVALVAVAALAIGIAIVLGDIGLKPRLEDSAHARLARAADHFAEVSAVVYAESGSWPLNRLAETLEHEEEIRKANAADLAHELRTPVNALLSRLEAAQDGVLAGPDNLEAMHAEALRLTRLLDDLARLADAERPGLLLDKAPVDLASVAKRVAASFAPRFDDSRVALLVEAEPVDVLGDEDRLEQIGTNLVANAWRYYRLRRDPPERCEGRRRRRSRGGIGRCRQHTPPRMRRFRGTVPVARRQLLAERAKLAVSVLAIAAAVALVLLLTGLRRGIAAQATLYLDRQPSVLVGQAGALNFVGQSSVLPEALAERLEHVPGVAAATPISEQFAMLTLHGRRVPASIRVRRAGLGAWRRDVARASGARSCSTGWWRRSTGSWSARWSRTVAPSCESSGSRAARAPGWRRSRSPRGRR